MAAHEHSETPQEPIAPWDGRARCRLCASDNGPDRDWCQVAGALVCDDCCEDVLGGEPARIDAAKRASSRQLAPMEVLASCATCPRLDRMIHGDDDSEDAPEPGTVLH